MVIFISLILWRSYVWGDILQAIAQKDYQVLLIIAFLTHIVLWFYFCNASLRNLKKSNFNIIDNINRQSKDYLNDIPKNLDKYLDAI